VGKVTYSKEFIDHLDSLIHILYEKEYFGYIESSIEYVLGIYDFLEQIFTNYPTRNCQIPCEYSAPILFHITQINKQLGISFLTSMMMGFILPLSLIITKNSHSI
jgi:hypothetical protein